MVGKCLLHLSADYLDRMDTPADRLKKARIDAGFSSAREAALAMDMKYETYNQHENGTRGFPASRAEVYARRFRVAAEWLLYGKGDAASTDPVPTEADLEKMIRLAIDEGVDMQTRLADLPRIVAPTLREQLERYAAERAALRKSASSARGKGARSPAPTSGSSQEG